MSSPTRVRTETTETLDREFAVIRSAIVMVASGEAPAVSLAGLQFGEDLLRPARRLALQAGVRVVPLWTIDERGADIRIEKFDE